MNDNKHRQTTRQPGALLQGFVLTHHCVDGPSGLSFHIWLQTPQGPVLAVVQDQEAVFFIRSEDKEPVRAALTGLKGWRLQALELKNPAGEPVSGLYFQRQRTLVDARTRLAEKGLACYEDDVRPVERYLMERFICGGVEVSGVVIPHKGYRRIDGAVLKRGDYLPTLRWLSLDIETTMQADQIFSVGLYAPHVVSKTNNSKIAQGEKAVQGEGSAQAKGFVQAEGSSQRDGSAQSQAFQQVLMVGEAPLNAPLTDAPPFIHYVADERALLQALVERINAQDPDLLIGWNVVGFDLSVLQRRADQLGVPLKIGRAGDRLRLRDGNGNLRFATLAGRLVLDGIDALKAATYSFESFALENVAQTLLGRGKKIEHVNDRGEEITRLYREDKQALATYNLEDCRLVSDIFTQTCLVEYLLERSRLTGLALDKIGGSAAAFDNLYLPRLHRGGYVAPVYASGESGMASPGGYVMESRPGLFDHVLVLDFKSLYPSIIRSFCIDPMGLFEGLAVASTSAQSEVVPGFNGAWFDRQQHILPGLLATLWAARDVAKAKRDEAVSRAIKIIMNSFYGVLGSPLCRFFDHRLSGSITLRGHQILTESAAFIEEQGYQVIYGDTDSLFIWLNRTCDNHGADVIGTELSRQLNHWWTSRLQQEFGLQSFLEIEYETHYRRFLMPTIRGSERGSKKRYCGLVEDSEGQPKLVFKGLETVRSDWTPLARKFQQELYRRVFLGEPYKDYVRLIVEQLKAGRLDEQLYYRKRLRRSLADYQKNIPPQVQAARFAESQGQRFRRGDAVRYLITLAGPQPEGFISSPVDYDHYLERQLEPVADGLLPFVGEGFKRLTAKQIDLF